MTFFFGTAFEEAGRRSAFSGELYRSAMSEAYWIPRAPPPTTRMEHERRMRSCWVRRNSIPVVFVVAGETRGGGRVQPVACSPYVSSLGCQMLPGSRRKKYLRI